MKVLQLIDTYNVVDGCSKHVRLLSEELLSKGHDVRIGTGGGDATATVIDDLNGFVIETMCHASRSIHRFISGVFALRKLLRAFSPDIIHAHHFYAANQARLARLGKHVPLILTVHQVMPCSARLPQYPGDEIIVVSKAVRESVVKCDARKSPRITVIPNGIRRVRSVTNDPHVHMLQKSKASSLSLLYCGRLVGEKGIWILFEALKLLKERLDFQFIVAGDGPLRDTFIEALKQARIETCYLGPVADVHSLFGFADILLVPSLKLEGLPMILLEAGLAGCAVIASNVDGIPEVIEHERTGLLVEPGRVEELAASIERLASNPSLRQSLGDTLKSTVESSFTLEHMTNRVLEVYRKSLQLS